MVESDVPQPSAMVLLAFSLLGFATYRRENSRLRS
ncbi:PEP-CTERM sorting domain-containing protein [Alteromonas aquimaris]